MTVYIMFCSLVELFDHVVCIDPMNGEKFSSPLDLPVDLASLDPDSAVFVHWNDVPTIEFWNWGSI